MQPPYWDKLYHLDLCILAYQIYNQTLVWPFDPWYERLTRKEGFVPGYKDKRARFMHHLHKTLEAPEGYLAAYYRNQANGRPYHGPGGARAAGFATNRRLDPVLHRYDRIDVTLPSFNFDGDGYTIIQAPPAVTNDIGPCHVCRYTANPDLATDGGNPQITQVSHGRGQGLLYCFEGGTGGLSDAPPAWSCMGFVLARSRNDGYDVHIVFRGSRSGSAARAASQGLMSGAGNADWVTDMDYSHTMQDPVLSVQGAVSRGFRNSVRQCMSSISACLRAISAHAGGMAPESISVTGHSLGGALATQFAMAAMGGGYNLHLRANFPDWPWNDLRLYSFAAPVVGNDLYVNHINQTIANLERIKVKGDPVTKDPITKLMTSRVGKKQVGNDGNTTRLDSVKAEVSPFGVHLFDRPTLMPSFEGHEPRTIRKKLLGAAPVGVHLPPDVLGDEFWPAPRSTFSAVLEDAKLSADRLRSLLKPSFFDDVCLFFDVYVQHLDKDELTILAPLIPAMNDLRSGHQTMQLLRAMITRINTLKTADRRYLGLLIVIAAMMVTDRINIDDIRYSDILRPLFEH
jgi:hypothetical protein